MIGKTVTVLVLLVIGNVAVSHIRNGYEMGRVVPPRWSLNELETTLADWRGSDLPADPRLREILQAKEGVDRVYRSESGNEVLLHAVWTDDYLRLHFPQQCYRESGWELTKTQDREIQCENGTAFPCKVLSFSQGDRRIQVLYWFQLGEHVFLDRVQHRLLRRKVCWGQKEWPPLMKFMLETSDKGLGRGEEALIDFASKVSAELDRTSKRYRSES
ncbi:MAG: exosortase C-terminal domain/associated protein EpsI [Planctomycetota bacterium]